MNGAERAENQVKRSVEQAWQKIMESGAAFLPLTLRSHNVSQPHALSMSQQSHSSSRSVRVI